MSDPVRAQYEAFPYPQRDPRDERKRLVIGSPSHLAELNHHVFGGRLDLRRPFRALVAGGGTGDAAIMLSQQLADAGAAAPEIVYLDWSEPARQIAQARAQMRGLGFVRFVTASLAELDRLGLGRFDYIDCCGVLHHLEDPAAGLRALADSLAAHGGIGLMLYGTHGRTGVYGAQAMLSALVRPEDDHAQRVALARRLLGQLPQTNWLRRNENVAAEFERDDGVYDVLLSPRDRAYEVTELAALAEGAGMRIVTFVPPARYAPESYVTDPRLRQRLAGLPALARPAFAERLAGNIKAHVFYAVKAANAVAPPDAAAPATTPIPYDAESRRLLGLLAPGGTLPVNFEGARMTFPLPRLARAIGERIDGQRTLAQIHASLREANPALDWARFAEEFAALNAALGGIGKLLLAEAPA